jgi:hypothetical protein
MASCLLFIWRMPRRFVRRSFRVSETPGDTELGAAGEREQHEPGQIEAGMSLKCMAV